MWIAESRAEIDAARLLVMDCAKQIDEIGSYGARKSVSVIKFYVAEFFERYWIVQFKLMVHWE